MQQLHAHMEEIKHVVCMHANAQHIVSVFVSRHICVQEHCFLPLRELHEHLACMPLPKQKVCFQSSRVAWRRICLIPRSFKTLFSSFPLWPRVKAAERNGFSMCFFFVKRRKNKAQSKKTSRVEWGQMKKSEMQTQRDGDERRRVWKLGLKRKK